MRAKVPPIKTEEGFCGPCNKRRCEIHHQNTSVWIIIYEAHISSDYKIWIAVLKLQFTFSLVKPGINNAQEALNNFGVDLIIPDFR